MTIYILETLPIGQKVGIAFSGGLDTSRRSALDEAEGRASLTPIRPTSASPTKPTTTRFRARPSNTAPKRPA